MRQVIILRGIPGSGKTTLINRLEFEYGEPAVICSADHFHYYGKSHIPENYKFDISKASLAHQTCRDNFVSALQAGERLVIVDNTNINQKDFEWYYSTARNYNYNVTFHSIRGCSVEQSVLSNEHNVPQKVIESMLNNYSETPKIINDEIVDEVVYDFLELRRYSNGKQVKKNQQECESA